MATPYIGEIRMFAGNFAPQGYLFCQGQTLSIPQYETLFALIGTTYGGDGSSNFKLPDLRSRLVIHAGSDGVGDTYTVGQTGGAESVNILNANLPFHRHAMLANNNANTADSASGAGGTFGNTSGGSGTLLYGSNGSGATLSTKAIGPAGGSQPHTNIKPFLCINFIIAFTGVYPPRS